MRYFLFISIILAVSCDRTCLFKYRVSNQTREQLKVVFFATNSMDVKSRSKRDSVLIEPFALKEIVLQGRGIGSIERVKEKGDTLQNFKYIYIYMNHSGMESKTNFLKTMEWEFEQTARRTGNYTASVDESDF